MQKITYAIERPIPRQREDIRYGDPHAPRGNHPFYGPDSFDMHQDPKKPILESHGFYMPMDQT